MHTVAVALIATLTLLAGCITIPPDPGQVRLMSIPPEHASRYSGDTSLREAIALAPTTAEKSVQSRFVATVHLALQNSLKTARLAAPATGGAPYTLHARITPVSVERPLFKASVNSSIVASVLYTLVRTVDGTEVFRAQIQTSHSATMGDSILAETRANIAFTGAYRKNIAQLVERLYQADIKP
jgi:hypothetical protein